MWLVAPLTIVGCVFLFLNLPCSAMLFLPGWGVLGSSSISATAGGRSHVGRGLTEVHEPEIHDIKPPVPGTE